MESWLENPQRNVKTKKELLSNSFFCGLVRDYFPAFGGKIIYRATQQQEQQYA